MCLAAIPMESAFDWWGSLVHNSKSSDNVYEAKTQRSIHPTQNHSKQTTTIQKII